jgi:restriction system protein
MGYGGSLKDAAQTTKKSNDEGIDGIIKEDKLGLDVIYVQAKRYKPENRIGREDIQKFVGVLATKGVRKGIFITTSSFGKNALEALPKNETKIVLIDGEQLAEYMIDYNLGVSISEIFEVKRLDNDFFDEE